MKNYFLNLSALVVLISFGLFGFNNRQEHGLNSPDMNIHGQFSANNGKQGFYMLFHSDTILSFSPIGMKVNQIDLSKNTTIESFSETTTDTIWQTVNGKFKEVRNHYNEYVINCETTVRLKYQIIFRLYNDGFAYRYIFPKQAKIDSISITSEVTSFNFKNNYTYWAYNGENHNLGPIKRNEESNKKVLTPMVIKTLNNHYLAIHEAEIIRYAPFSINATEKNNTLTVSIEPFKDKLPLKTSWRTFIIGNRPGNLPESNLLVNLNEPCKIKNPSWIKPGKSVWDWRVLGFKAQDGFEYGLNTLSHKRLIDFAKENNIQNLLIDADWYGDEFSEESDPTNAREGVNIKECMAYANGKGIGVILYLNDVGAKKFGLERVLKQFHDWGAIGVKYGFMKDDDMQNKVRQTRKVVELCAKYQLMVDFHDGPIPPSGDLRTWPNLVSREYGHGQADSKKSVYPETFVNQIFINQIAGPIDMTNGWFDLKNAKESRIKVFEDIPSTIVAEVAKTIAVYTGWNVLPDAPEAYLKYNDLFDCIRQIPAQFDSFKVLGGDLDKYVSVARKAGDNWFIGTLTNRKSRTVVINFTFLPKGEKYDATFYEDAEDADFMKNKEAYVIRHQQIDNNSKVKIRMAAGGGNAIWLKQKNTNRFEPSNCDHKK